MPWFRCDDQLGDHPKVVALDEKLLPAMGLWLMCGVYCSKHLTDGFVPRKVVRLHEGLRLVKLLESSGLFEAVPGGWQMHDYLEWNPSKAQVLETRAQRRASGQAGGRASAQANARPNAQANAAAPSSSTTSTPYPVPVSQVRLDVPSNGVEWADPMTLYLARTRRKTLSRKEENWIEDLHARFSRTELVSALRAVDPGPDYLRRVDSYLEGR